MLATIASALLCCAAHAHDIPNDVKVQAFLKPEGQRLQLLVRVPLSAMREADIPLRGPGFVDLPNAQPALLTAVRLWLIDNLEIYEGETRLADPHIAHARVALASDKSFASFEQALATVQSAPLPGDLDVYWRHQYLDTLIEYPIASAGSEFAIHPHFARMGLQVVTALRFLPPGRAERAFEIHGDGELVRLDPRWHQAAFRFVELGFRHILDGIDHLLFIACLVIPFRRLRPLIVIATGFTLAHSVTLAAAACGFAPEGLWFPPLVETLIATSIVYMALENIVGSNPARRWIYAFAFGLIHGFGFSFALREQLQFAGDHLVTSLLGFNVGVEIGQIAVLLVLVPALNLLFRYVVAERIGVIILSALVAHTGWHWMLERGAVLAKFPFPTLDAAFFVSLMRGAMAALILTGAVWLASGLVRRLMQGKDGDGFAEGALAKAPSAKRR